MKQGHWVYMTHPERGTVHLIDFDTEYKLAVPKLRDEVKTLCGVYVLCNIPEHDLVGGDETTSGVAADCGTCLKAIGRVKSHD